MIIRRSRVSLLSVNWDDGRPFAPLATHPDLEIVRITDGESVWNINGIDYPVRRGDFVILSPVDYRRFVGEKKSGRFALEFILVGGNHILSPRHAGLFYLRPPGFRNLLPSDSPHTLSLSRLYDEIRPVLLQRTWSELDGEIVVRTLSLMCTHMEYIYAPLLEGVTDRQNKLVTDAVGLISSSDLSKLTVEALSDALYCTPEHLSRLFHRHVGITLSQYLCRVRVLKALELSQKSDCTVADAARLVGYSSVSGFYKQLRKQNVGGL